MPSNTMILIDMKILFQIIFPKIDIRFVFNININKLDISLNAENSNENN